MENGWKSDFDNDQDYFDNIKTFKKNFPKNMNKCRK
jgi:hypothetical protein